MEGVGGTAPYGEREDRGAGGKVRKPPSRKPAASPYARPGQKGPEAGQRRWLSKLVDPAYRLISGGATRIFPSFFSKSDSTSALTSPSSGPENHGTSLRPTTEHGDSDDHKRILDLGISKSSGLEGGSGMVDNLNSSSYFNEHKITSEKEDQPEDNTLSKIELLVKGKTFSRDEVNQILDIINSKAVDHPNDDKIKKNLSLDARKDSEGPVAAQEFPRVSNDQKWKDLNGLMNRTATHLFQSNVDDDHVNASGIKDDIAASPIDIARAYMTYRTSEAGPNSKSTVPKPESTVLHADDPALKPYIPPSSPKSPSTRWPGAIVQNDYFTPQTQRGRYGLHNFPRTPYSRTILSKSRLNPEQGDQNMLTPFHQSQTPLFGQVKSRSDAYEGGSLGPIHRRRHNVGAHFSASRSSYADASVRGSHFHSSINDHSEMERSNAEEDFFSAVTKKFEPGETSFKPKFQSLDSKPHGSDGGVSTVPSHTRFMARKILEHIDRNPPTPKEKSAELKMATKWKKPEASVVNSLSNKNNLVMQLGEVAGDGEGSIIRRGDQGDSIPPPKPERQAVNIISKEYALSDGNTSSVVPVLSKAAMTSLGFPTTGDEMKSTVKDDSESDPDPQKKDMFHSSSSKPILPSISINNREPRWTFSSDNSSGFTFPVSASFSMLSEPPTPSILPSVSAGGLHQSKEESTMPLYTFGSKRSSPLEFSFASTSTSAVDHDACDIKYSFGSDEKTRLCFSSFGKNAVCY